MSERLQKLIAQAGLASRRQAEDWIRAGRVRVNGAPAVLGQTADPERDTVEVDGVPLGGRKNMVYIMLNKPPGYVTTASDERARRTVLELVADVEARVWPVGRLDMYSQGLLLLTNDGALTRRLTHPGHGVKKVYQVRVTGDVDAALPVLRGPMVLDGRPLKPCRIRLLRREKGSALLEFILTEGRNRQIRRMCQAAGLRVVRLCRVREAGISLGALPEGQWRHLTADEVESLQRS